MFSNNDWIFIWLQDFFAANTYTFRWTTYANALKNAFPELREFNAQMNEARLMSFFHELKILLQPLTLTVPS